MTVLSLPNNTAIWLWVSHTVSLSSLPSSWVLPSSVVYSTIDEPLCAIICFSLTIISDYPISPQNYSILPEYTTSLPQKMR